MPRWSTAMTSKSRQRRHHQAPGAALEAFAAAPTALPSIVQRAPYRRCEPEQEKDRHPEEHRHHKDPRAIAVVIRDE
jgi:hypothetical protein